MKTLTINYAYGKSIEIEIPRKIRNKKSIKECLIAGDYRVFNVKVVGGLQELLGYAVKNANDKSSNRGRWYAHFNGYCLDIVVDYNTKTTGIITLNTYYNYRKSTN